MRQKLRSITQSLRLPALCVLCHQFHHNRLAVCTECIALLTPLGFCCQQCASPLFDNGYPLCGQCIKTPPYFDSALVHYRFEEPLRSLLHQFKYNNSLYLTSFLGELIIQAQSTDGVTPQCLIPVPMHHRRLKTRGFNQAAVLARFLAKKLAIPCDSSSCVKTVNTSPQAELGGELRRKNLRNAFACDTLNYKHVALVDDLLTTGSTANELARTLKKAGVERVDIWCCARTISKEQTQLS